MSNGTPALALKPEAVIAAAAALGPSALAYAKLRWNVRGYPSKSIEAAACALRVPAWYAEKMEDAIRERVGLERRITVIEPPPAPAREEEPPPSLIATFDIAAGIIAVSEAVSSRLLAAIEREPALLHRLEHRAFEELVALLFAKFGYEVELTKRSRDGGRDVIAIKHAEVNVRHLIECKHPKLRRTIGIRPVRELYAVRVDERATKAILATTGMFSRDARLFEQRNEFVLELRDFNGVMDWVRFARSASTNVK